MERGKGHEMLERSFRALPADALPAGLAGRIVARIFRARERAERVRATAFGIATVLSLVALVPAVRFILVEAARSPFLSYVSLVVSDWSGAMAAWREILLALAESAPWGGITATAALVLTFLVSLRAALRHLGSSFAEHGMAVR